MPVISCFTDLHSVSLLLYKSNKDFWYKDFPYVYSNQIFSSSFTLDAFYTSLFETLCQEHGVVLKECDILMTGFLEPPVVSFKVSLAKSIYEVFSKIKTNYPVLVNNYSIFTPDFCFSTSNIKPRHRPSEIVDAQEENYYSNLEIYPQLVSNEVGVQIDLDGNIAALLRAKTRFPTNLPLVFCGSRFSQKTVFPELDYLLMLDLIRNPGVYEIERDGKNSVILTTLLNMFDPKINLKDEVEKEGFVITSIYPLECMIQANDGTSQLVQLDKDRILVVPINDDEKLKLSVKAHDLGEINKNVLGGKVGIIFDTRENKKIVAEDIRVFSSGIKAFRKEGN